MLGTITIRFFVDAMTNDNAEGIDCHPHLPYFYCFYRNLYRVTELIYYLEAEQERLCLTQRETTVVELDHCF